MSETIYVLKCLLATLFLAIFMQVKVQGISLEKRMHHWTQESSTAHTLREVAQGGVKFLNQMSLSIRQGFEKSNVDSNVQAHR